MPPLAHPALEPALRRRGNGDSQHLTDDGIDRVAHMQGRKHGDPGGISNIDRIDLAAGRITNIPTLYTTL